MIVNLDPHRLREAIAAVGGNKVSIARQSGVSAGPTRPACCRQRGPRPRGHGYATCPGTPCCP